VLVTPKNESTHENDSRAKLKHSTEDDIEEEKKKRKKKIIMLALSNIEKKKNIELKCRQKCK
jgi:hypothetical protein